MEVTAVTRLGLTPECLPCLPGSTPFQSYRHRTNRTMSSSSRQYPGMQFPDYERNKPRIFLAIACFWPFVLLALFASSAPRVPAVVDESPAERLALQSSEDLEISEGSGLRLKLRNVLDRVDIMGYGPTHPRIGVVVTGSANAQDKKPFVDTVDSIFSHTDLSRIFIVTVVVDGHKEDPAWEGALKKINKGQIPHLHGLRLDLHQSKQQSSNNQNDEQSQHESKVHVMFNEEARGVTTSRQDGADFIHILAKHHERAGLKSPAEDIILLVIEAGTVLKSRKWLPTVTDALIVPPPILPSSEMEDVVSLKMANAVSFNVEGPGKRTSFDAFLTPQIGAPNAEELNLSSGTSYMAPAWNGAALALRLETYRQLPMHDEALMETWPANLDLSMALWLCADGIDMIQGDDDALVVEFSDRSLDPTQSVSAPLSPSLGARFAEAWMDEELQRKFFHSYTHEYEELTYLEWQTYQAQARMSPSFVKDLSTKCRSMSWYINKVNTELSSVLEQSALVDNPKPIQEDPVIDGKKFESLEKFLESQKDSGGAKQAAMQKEGEGVDEDSIAIPERREEQKKPSKPLCDECRKIVEKAKPVDLAYVDMTGGHKDHPHMGAKDVHGNYGFVHNATHLHDDPPSFNMPEESLIKACKRRDNNYRMLTEKVRVDFKGEKEAQHTREKRAKIFCLVYTIEKAHTEIPRIRETWGQKCDGFMVASTKSDPSIDAVEIPHEGPEEVCVY